MQLVVALLLLSLAARLRTAPHALSPPHALHPTDAFERAVSLCSSTGADGSLRALPALLDGMFREDQAVLLRTAARTVINTSCRRPLPGGVYASQHGGMWHRFGGELAQLPLEAGRRMCAAGACATACSRVTLRRFATAAEVVRMAQLATSLLAPRDSGVKQRVDHVDLYNALARRGKPGSPDALAALLLLLRLVERARRAIAREYARHLNSLRSAKGTHARIARRCLAGTGSR